MSNCDSAKINVGGQGSNYYVTARGTNSLENYLNQEQRCGGGEQGGAACKSLCCDAQETYCKKACFYPVDLPGCIPLCMQERGCSWPRQS